MKTPDALDAILRAEHDLKLVGLLPPHGGVKRQIMNR
jgi:hypothetical protein